MLEVFLGLKMTTSRCVNSELLRMKATIKQQTVEL